MSGRGDAEGAHGVEDGQDGDSDVGEYGHPHGAESNCGQGKYGHLYTDGEPDVLTGDTESAACYGDSRGYLGRLVVHQYYVGCLYRCVAAQPAHGDAHIGPFEHRRVVGASLMPSPTKARLRPAGFEASSCSRYETLSAGSRAA